MKKVVIITQKPYGVIEVQTKKNGMEVDRSIRKIGGVKDLFWVYFFRPELIVLRRHRSPHLIRDHLDHNHHNKKKKRRVFFVYLGGGNGPKSF